MRLYRTIILLLLTMFLADTVAASSSLHLPAVSPATARPAAHQHHVTHDHAQHDDGAYQHDEQHGDNCRNCHDCLSCFSVLPISIRMSTPDLPPRQVDIAPSLIYFPPALAQWQRPPIPPSI
ncbi:hypothetical protein ACW4YW_02850 [Methylobacillus pratensis]